MFQSIKGFISFFLILAMVAACGGAKKDQLTVAPAEDPLTDAGDDFGDDLDGVPDEDVDPNLTTTLTNLGNSASGSLTQAEAEELKKILKELGTALSSHIPLIDQSLKYPDGIDAAFLNLLFSKANLTEQAKKDLKEFAEYLKNKYPKSQYPHLHILIDAFFEIAAKVDVHLFVQRQTRRYRQIPLASMTLSMVQNMFAASNTNRKWVYRGVTLKLYESSTVSCNQGEKKRVVFCSGIVDGFSGPWLSIDGMNTACKAPLDKTIQTQGNNISIGFVCAAKASPLAEFPIYRLTKYRTIAGGENQGNRAISSIVMHEDPAKLSASFRWLINRNYSNEGVKGFAPN